MIHRYLYLLILVVGLLPEPMLLARDKVGSAETLLMEGRLEEIREWLPALKRRFPHHATVHYLTGLFQTDARTAVRSYEHVRRRSRTQFSDDALFRLGQYYYTLGEYYRAQRYFSELAREYDSKLRDDAVFLYGQCQLAHGQLDSAKRVFSSFIKSFPHSPYVDVVVMDLESPSLWQSTSSGVVYRVQIGAFTRHSFADRRARTALQAGFTPEVFAKGNHYVVTIGDFSSRQQAEKAAERYRDQTGGETYIVTNE
jgi:tetratricopeptide (TPR) repeat protein